MRRKIGIFTDSQAAMKALQKDFINSKILLECINSLNDISNSNEICIKWVPGHAGIYGNELVDAMAKKG